MPEPTMTFEEWLLAREINWNYYQYMIKNWPEKETQFRADYQNYLETGVIGSKDIVVSDGDEPSVEKPVEPGHGEGDVSDDGKYRWTNGEWVAIELEGPLDKPPLDKPGVDGDGGDDVGFLDWYDSQGFDRSLLLNELFREKMRKRYQDYLATDTTTDTTTDTDDDFSQQLAAAVEAIRQESREAYESRRAEAMRVGARRTGKMSRMQQQALLAQGRPAGEIEQLMAGGQEAGARSLNDLLQALSVGQKERQAEIGRMGIGAMISGEELGIRERQLAQQETQYQQTFGLSQQQLAQQAQYQQGQLGLGREQAQASIWAPLFGALGTIGGSVIGGPIGAGIGGAIGKWAGSKWPS